MSHTRSKKDEKNKGGKRKREEKVTTLQDGGGEADKLRRQIQKLEKSIIERDLTILELIREKEAMGKRAELSYQNIDYVRQIQFLMYENMRLSLENYQLMQISQTNSGGMRNQQSQLPMSVEESELLESILQSDPPKDKKAQEEIEKIMQELQGGSNDVARTNNSSDIRRDIDLIFPLSMSSLQTTGSSAVQDFTQLQQPFLYPAASHYNGQVAVPINDNALRDRTTISNGHQHDPQYSSTGSKPNPNTFYARPQQQSLASPQQEKQNFEGAGFIRRLK